MFDVVIIGGSFAGLSAALQLARARRTILVLDGNQPRNRFARHSHGFLSRDGYAPSAILHEARTQLLHYPTARVEQATVTAVVQHEGGFQVTWADQQAATARRLILATGVVDHLPDVAGVAERWGEGVAQCPYCHGYEVAERRLGVLATGESALHQATMLPDWSAHVTLFTNGFLTLKETDRARLARRSVQIIETPVQQVLGPGRTVAAVELADGRVVPLDALFVTTTVSLAAPFAEQLGCALEAGPFGPMITTDAFQETTVQGVFAAGDAARPMHNLSWAVADGVMAGISAHRSLIFTDNH
ncbi:MAG: NAD(P)/FAD-dependent oxidoreductase [Chloroflexaceae bacterium]|jgi:thioredoxin reductase|nr:NAD(P)/FAD-dependent oxidoreductase [Chloroflexaceae bacterium]